MATSMSSRDQKHKWIEIIQVLGSKSLISKHNQVNCLESS